MSTADGGTKLRQHLRLEVQLELAAHGRMEAVEKLAESRAGDVILQCVAKSWKDARGGDFEFVATAFGFEIGRTAGKPAKHRRVRVFFGSYVCCRFERDVEGKGSSNGIRDVHTVDCVGALARAGTFLVVHSVQTATTPGFSSGAL
jgi:hypothetical protein